MKKILAFLISLLLLSGCGVTAVADTVPEAVTGAVSDGGGFITLSDQGSSFTGSGVTLSGNAVSITAGGEYTVTGSLGDGQLVIDAPKSAKVELTMDNADISCSDSAALYVRSADKLVITLAAGSKNALRSTGSFVQTDDNNVDAALFSKDDLTVKGSGVLEVSCEAGHGIVGKDDLKISGGDIRVTASDKGIAANDSLTVKGGSINIASGDDAMNCDGDISISGGELTLSSGDDGIHSDAALSVSGGNIRITKSYEGLEGLTVSISGGDVSITASDDGINATGGNDGSGFEGAFGDDGPFHGGMGGFFGGGKDADAPGGGPFGRPSGGDMPQPPNDNMPQPDGDMPQFPDGNMPGSGGGDSTADADSDAVITISGGSLTICAEGDGIDSNGALYVTGGNVFISGPTNGGNGALDYASEGVITGGSFIAAGSSEMAENFGDRSTQCSILYSFSRRMSAGTEVSLVSSDGAVIARYSPEKDFSSIVISVPELETGSSYTLIADGSSTEIAMDGVLYGNRGMDAFGGGPGGFGGMGGTEPPGGFGKRK